MVRFGDNTVTTLKTLAMGLVVTTVFAGCSGTGTGHKEYDKEMHSGHYLKAATIVETEKDTEAELDDAHLLATVKAGNGYLYAKDYPRSVAMLDEAEGIIKYHREQILAGDAADTLAKILINDSAVDYHASLTDSIMLNTYKSIDYMILGDNAKARVELNRAIDRQRRAKETYAELIGKQQEAIAKETEGDDGSAKTKSMNNPELKKIVNQNYSNLDGFKAYPDFVNPFTTYLAGLFFAIEGDYTKSSNLLKEAHGMAPENKTLETDFQMVEDALNGTPVTENYVWVIYENGLGPIKKELKVNIPLWLVTNKMVYAGIALPRMLDGEQATPDLEVFSNDKMLSKTEIVADIDRVIYTEFNYTYDDVVARAVLSAITKTYAQYAASEYGGENGKYASLAIGLFAAATTAADTRMWSSLPTDFQVTRVKMPENRTLQLKAGTHKINVALGKNAKHSIVYVRIPTTMSMPSYSVANF